MSEEIVRAINERVWEDCDREDARRPALEFAHNPHGGVIDVVDPQDEYRVVDTVPEELIGANARAVLNLVNRNQTQGYLRGERYGAWKARSEMRRALGIEDAFLRLERDQRREDARV